MLARSVARLTVGPTTPGRSAGAASIVATHDAQLIPLIGSSTVLSGMRPLPCRVWAPPVVVMACSRREQAREAHEGQRQAAGDEQDEGHAPGHVGGGGGPGAFPGR